LFFDESRFGTHSKLGHGWFATGSRSPVNVKLAFQNFYLYTASCSCTGESFSLILPQVNTTCMNLFLAKLSEEFAGDELMVVMDGAGWHKSKGLHVPKNIKIIYLPPYSPELNPVERLWLYIKRAVLRNKIYESLDELEDAVCDFLNSITPQVMSRVCSANHMFI
jgi:hypothetical protein